MGQERPSVQAQQDRGRTEPVAGRRMHRENIPIRTEGTTREGIGLELIEREKRMRIAPNRRRDIWVGRSRSRSRRVWNTSLQVSSGSVNRIPYPAVERYSTLLRSQPGFEFRRRFSRQRSRSRTIPLPERPLSSRPLTSSSPAPSPGSPTDLLASQCCLCSWQEGGQ